MCTRVPIMTAVKKSGVRRGLLVKSLQTILVKDTHKASPRMTKAVMCVKPILVENMGIEMVKNVERVENRIQNYEKRHRHCNVPYIPQ